MTAFIKKRDKNTIIQIPKFIFKNTTQYIKVQVITEKPCTFRIEDVKAQFYHPNVYLIHDVKNDFYITCSAPPEEIKAINWYDSKRHELEMIMEKEKSEIFIQGFENLNWTN